MYTVYRMQPEDKIPEIATNYNLSLPELLDINPQIKKPSDIEPGQPINVPATGVTNLNIPESSLPGWYLLARDEMEKGIIQTKGNEHNPRILEYHQTTTLAASDDETAWCSSFVNWCVESSGHVGTKSAAARSWLNWGVPLRNPNEGCIVVLERGTKPWQGHVGFYVEDSGSNMRVLGGNQNNEVNISSYPKALVLGYRWVNT